MNKIKTWQERTGNHNVRPGSVKHMIDEITELRAALAATQSAGKPFAYGSSTIPNALVSSKAREQMLPKNSEKYDVPLYTHPAAGGVPDALCEAVAGLVNDIDSLIGESSGVYGLHLNGDPAPWDELVEGGRFERLTHLGQVRALLATRSAKEIDKPFLCAYPNCICVGGTTSTCANPDKATPSPQPVAQGLDARDLLKQAKTALETLLLANRITHKRTPPETVMQAENELASIKAAVTMADQAIGAIEAALTKDKK